MRYVKLFSVLAFAGLLLAGCASVAHVEKDKNANFSNYQTYAWVDTKGKDDTAKTKVSDLTERTIKEAVNSELVKSGWKESKHKPDVLLTYDVLVEKNIKDQSNAVYSDPFTRYYYNPYSRRW